MCRDGSIMKFGGSILRLRNEAMWRGSPWEAADILWDGNDGLQTVSMFETLVEDPVSYHPSLPTEVRDACSQVIEEMKGKEIASSIVDCLFIRFLY